MLMKLQNIPWETTSAIKAPITTAAEDSFNFYFIFFFFFIENKSDISCELSARQTIHMKCKDLFSIKK